MSKQEAQQAKSFIQFTPQIHDSNGRPIGWAKAVTHVDKTKTDGQAIMGLFLNEGVEIELPVGSIILYVIPESSNQNGYEIATIHRLESDGSQTNLSEKELDWDQDFASIRDLVAEAIAKSFPDEKDKVTEKTSR